MVLSWIVSPVLSGIIVAILYGLIRTFVLRSKHSFTRAFYVSPSVTIFLIYTCCAWSLTEVHPVFCNQQDA